MALHLFDPEPLAQDAREAKLPIWAQEVIVRLREQAAEARSLARAAQLDTDPRGTAAVIDPLGLALGVPAGAREIGFRAPVIGGRPYDSFIRVRQTRDGEGNALGIEVSGDGALSVRPWVTNVVKIEQVAR